MNSCTPNLNHNLRTFVVSLLMYVLLTGQLTPPALAADRQAHTSASIKLEKSRPGNSIKIVSSQ